jgi:hypothetical protein
MKLYPETYRQGDFVFFLHIPKTAGTSLGNALKRGFPKDGIVTPLQMNNAKKQSTEVLERAELLCGHFTLRMCQKRLPRQPDLVLTFLRDPVQHYVSLFFHLKIDPTFAYTIRLTKDKSVAQALHQKIADASIEDFLAMDESAQFDNFQTRYLVSGLCAEYEALSDTGKLPVAQRALLELPFFGLADRYDDSLSLLEHTLADTVRLRSTKSNKSRNKPKGYTLQHETISVIEQRTWADRQLLQLAHRVFESRMQAFSAGG